MVGRRPGRGGVDAGGLGGGAATGPGAGTATREQPRPTGPSNAGWLPAVERALGGPARVRGRAPLAGGYSLGVERVDLDVGGRAVAIVLKRASAVEVAAMRAVAVVGGVDRPLAIGADWIVTRHVEGPSLVDGAPVPAAVWEILARVHAHWWRKRPRGLPVVDGAWWARLCDRTLVAVRGAAARTGDEAFTAAELALLAWRANPPILAALAVLPRTLVHGDPHRGNVRVGPAGAVLIDWGNARVAPCRPAGHDGHPSGPGRRRHLRVFR